MSNNTGTGSSTTGNTINNSAATLDACMVHDICSRIIKNNYIPTAPQKALVKLWSYTTLKLVDKNVIDTGNYPLMVKCLEGWLRTQGKPVLDTPNEYQPKTTGSIIEVAASVPAATATPMSDKPKPIKKSDAVSKPSEIATFDHTRIHAIMNQMVATKNLVNKQKAEKKGKAYTNQRKPVITLSYKDAVTGSLEEVVLKQTLDAGTGKDPGCTYINVNGEWLYRLGTKGNLDKNHNTSSKYDWLDKFLAEFAANPAEVAAKSGHISSKCCVCNLKLTDKRSIIVGYGKTCAANMGWSWGEGVTPNLLSEESLNPSAESGKPEVVAPTLTEVEQALSEYNSVKLLGASSGTKKLKVYSKIAALAKQLLPDIELGKTAHYYADALIAWCKNQQPAIKPESANKVKQPSASVVEPPSVTLPKPANVAPDAPVLDTINPQVASIKAVLAEYYKAPMPNFNKMKAAVLAILPELPKRAKAVVYLDAIYNWIDAQKPASEPITKSPITITEPAQIEQPVSAPIEPVKPTVIATSTTDKSITQPVDSVDPTPAIDTQVRLTESNNTVNRAEIEQLATAPSSAIGLSPESQAILDSIKGTVSDERYQQLYDQMLALEVSASGSASGKVKKPRKSSDKPRSSKKDPMVMVNEIAQLCDLADAESMDAAFIASGRTDSKYMPRAYRSYREIYQKSVKIQELVNSGKLAWGSVHHYLAGRNPAKCGIEHLEDFAQALVDGLWIDPPTPVNPRPLPRKKD
jgi:hypothetical protein